MMVFTKDTVSPMTEAVATTPAIALNTNSDQVYDKKKEMFHHTVYKKESTQVPEKDYPS